MNCPHCNAKLEQETYYDDVYGDTGYYNICPLCGWNDYPEHLIATEPKESEPMRITCADCPYHWAEDEYDYPSCHYPYDDGYAPCEWE